MTNRIGHRVRRGHRARAGFTIVELAIASAILLVLAGTLVQSARSMRNSASNASVMESLETRGVRALQRISSDLRRSGFGGGYPHLFVDSGAAGIFAAHAHPPAVKVAEDGEYDFGPNREIVFRLPLDADGDGVPDVDGDGALTWDASEFSYVVVTNAEGVNVLERRVDAGNPVVIARHVERIAFDDSATAGAAAVPLNAIRVQIFFRQADEQGRVARYATETVIWLRNG